MRVCDLSERINNLSVFCARSTHANTHLHVKGGRVDAVELSEAVLQHAEPHGGLHHVNALQVEVIDGVQAGDASGAGHSQSQELLCCGGDGLAGRVVPEGESRGVATRLFPTLEKMN